jgi:DNA-binding response OmpR family regulator
MTNNEFDFSISILVLDADEASRRLLSDTLSALGFQILQAGSLDDAWKILSAQKIDLVMADVILPEGNGIEFMMRLKEEQPRIPIIILASAIDTATRDELIRIGADGIITKPFRINLVEEAITSTLMKYDKAALSIDRPKLKILIVDDDNSVLAFLVDAVKVLGYDAIACRTGAAAKEAFSSAKFDLVISDFMLPDINGVLLLKDLKSNNPALPIVIVTGYPLAYTHQMAKADGIDGYLGKPFRINQLEQVIASLLYPAQSHKRPGN